MHIHRKKQIVGCIVQKILAIYLPKISFSISSKYSLSI